MWDLGVIQVENINLDLKKKKKDLGEGGVCTSPLQFSPNLKIPLFHKQAKAVIERRGCKLDRVTLYICVVGFGSKTEHSIPQWGNGWLKEQDIQISKYLAQQNKGDFTVH